jgi:hypothetical protein
MTFSSLRDRLEETMNQKEKKGAFRRLQAQSRAMLGKALSPTIKKTSAMRCGAMTSGSPRNRLKETCNQKQNDFSRTATSSVGSCVRSRTAAFSCVALESSSFVPNPQRPRRKPRRLSVCQRSDPPLPYCRIAARQVQSSSKSVFSTPMIPCIMWIWSCQSPPHSRRNPTSCHPWYCPLCTVSTTPL